MRPTIEGAVLFVPINEPSWESAKPGEKLRFEAVLHRYSQSLRRIACGYARTTPDREELLQELSLALWKALPSFRGECSERTFVFRVAHNVALAVATRRRARGEANATDPHETLEALASHAPSPEEQLAQARRRQLLFAALERLPAGQREVLMLALEGLSHEEIAGVLGLNANVVGFRLHRAREALRTMLEEETQTSHGAQR